MYHRAFGLRIKSNLPIPGLVAAAFIDSIDLDVNFGTELPPSVAAGTAVPETVSSSNESHAVERPLYRFSAIVEGQYYRLTYSDGTDFVFDRAATKLWANWRAPLTLEDTATYLLGPVFGFLLRLRGVTCLHASAVILDGRAIALVGAAGAGKSTTAAAFARRGLPILCDDVMAIGERGGRFFIEPAYPRLRLWPDAVTMLYGAPDVLPRLTPSWEKRYLDLNRPQQRFQAQAVPLEVLYFLTKRSEVTDAPRILPLRKRDGLMRAIAHTYSNLQIDDAPRARDFAVLGRLVDQVRVRQIVPHRDPARLEDLCKKILDDVNTGCALGDQRGVLEAGHV